MQAKYLILHTYGLGDVIMAAPSLNYLQDSCESQDNEFLVVVRDHAAHQFLEYAGINCKQGGVGLFLKEALINRFRRIRVLSARTAGGSVWKDRVFRLFLKFIKIDFYYVDRSITIATKKLNYREGLNWHIVFELASTLQRQVYPDAPHPTKDIVCKEEESSYPEVHVFFDLSCIARFPLKHEPNKIFFHFGSGDHILKELSEASVNLIIVSYRERYVNSEFALISGPRDRAVLSLESEGLEVIGGDNQKSIKELVELGSEGDLIVCNDTGIGHLFSVSGVKVDLVVNKGQRALLHQVLPPTLRNLILI